MKISSTDVFSKALLEVWKILFLIWYWKILFFVSKRCLLFFSVLFLSFISSKDQLSLNDQRHFLQWMRTNNKFNTGDEYHFRLGIFLSNARYCQKFNRKKGLTDLVLINFRVIHQPNTSQFRSQTNATQSISKYNINQKKKIFRILLIGVIKAL